ncbi:3-keto-disaccharide hydrolase [Mucilaginibacter sp.]
MKNDKFQFTLVSTLAFVSMLIFSCQQQPAATSHNTLTDAEQKEGFKILFDGKTLHNWHIYNKGDTASAWKVSNGELWCDSKVKNIHADLISDEPYQNYDFRYEWKIARAGNSGVIINVQEDAKHGATFVTGPEMQLEDDENSPVHKGHPTQMAGSIFNVVPTNESVKPKPFGQWNTGRIVQQNGKLTLWLNDKITATADLSSTAWKQAIQQGKMQVYPDFGKTTQGKIALQDHLDNTYFRDIRIKKL